MSSPGIDARSGRSPRVVTFPLTLLLYVAVALVLDDALLVWANVPVLLSDGLVLPLAALFGVPGALGVATGVVVIDAVRIGLSPVTPVDSAALLTLGYVGRLLWKRSPSGLGRTSATGPIGSWVGVVVTVVVSCVIAASVLAWGYEIFGLYPFYVSFVSAVLSYVIATAIVAPPLVFVFLRTGLLSNFVSLPPGGRYETDRWISRRVALVAGLWATVGTIGSLGFTIREKVPLEAFRRYDVTYLYEFVHPDVFGHGGRRVQIVFGAVMIAIGYVVTRTAREEGVD